MFKKSVVKNKIYFLIERLFAYPRNVQFLNYNSIFPVKKQTLKAPKNVFRICIYGIVSNM